MATRTNNASPQGGFNGDPLREVVTTTWTAREALAIKRKAKFGSRAKVVRSLIDQKKLAAMIKNTEAAAARLY